LIIGSVWADNLGSTCMKDEGGIRATDKIRR
jgi:hypothetical protein